MTDGVEESTAAGGAGVAAQQVRGAAFHQASTATRGSYEVRLVLGIDTLAWWRNLLPCKQPSILRLAPNKLGRCEPTHRFHSNVTSEFRVSVMWWHLSYFPVTFSLFRKSFLVSSAQDSGKASRKKHNKCLPVIFLMMTMMRSVDDKGAKKTTTTTTKTISLTFRR